MLAVFFIRFADLQHYGYTFWHLLLLIFDGLVLHWYWPGFTQNSKPVAWNPLVAMIFAPLWLAPYLGRKVLDEFNLSRAQLLLLWLSNIAVLWTLVLFIVIQTHIDFGSSPMLIKQALAWEETSRNLAGINLVPRLNLSGFRLTLPDKFFEVAKLQQPGKNESQLWQETHNALDLSWRRLAFADFSFALLPHSNLSNAKLQGASFNVAQLQGVDLSSARMQGASLISAHLQGANLKSTLLNGAALEFSHLQGANLLSARLQNAFLWQAKLQGASFEFARLQGAYLKSAQLQGAYLSDAQLQGVDLCDAELQGALLMKTLLNGVVLSDSKRLAFSWIEQIDWKQGYDFSRLKTESWAQQDDVQFQLERIQQQVKTFKLPQLSPLADKETFATIWLDLLCKDVDATEGMLKPLNYIKGHPVTKTQAQQYLNSHEQCAPYRNMLAD